jgi:hypothetical protein
MSKTAEVSDETLTAIEAGAVTIKPYVDPTVENMGLQKYGLVLFDGVAHEEQLACVTHNGVVRWLTGLNEFAPEIQAIKDLEVKAAKIMEIRKVVAHLEQALNSNVVDPKDKDFWSKIEYIHPNNEKFWSTISLRCSNEDVILNPKKDPIDLIKLYAIEAGGFQFVAKNFEVARSMPVPPKFYLDKAVETTITKIEVKQLRNKALAELQKLFDKNQERLFLVAKVTDANSVQYKKTTPYAIIYDCMDKFIHGVGVERSEKRAAQQFLDTTKLDMETLKLKAIIKDATFYKFIAPKADGVIYHVASNTIMGRNPSECLEFLKNPLNEKTLDHLMKTVEEYWAGKH